MTRLTHTVLALLAMTQSPIALAGWQAEEGDRLQQRAERGDAPGADEIAEVEGMLEEAMTDMRAIAAGEESAQAAFMGGRLKLGGDMQLLIDHVEILTALGLASAAPDRST